MTMTSVEVKDIPIEFCYIEGGSFDMGSNDQAVEKPIHQVEVPSFYLGQCPITNQQFLPFLNEKGNQEEGGNTWVNLNGNYKGVRCGILKSADKFECIKGLEQHPMIHVSWYGVKAYCEWLGTQTGENYRLPSESGWEYAAKGGKYKTEFIYAGSNNLLEVSWYSSNSHGQTKPVGLKLSNALGLYDMSGNVWEWCADHWHENYKGAPQNGSAWATGGDNSQRVVRGGSWVGIDYSCRVSYRRWNYAYNRLDRFGFRVARY